MTPTERVLAELERRSLTVAEAARLSGEAQVSDQTWHNFLNTGQATPRVVRAIAAAFGWTTDWPDNLPPFEVMLPSVDPAVVNLTERLDRLERRQERLIELLERLLRDDMPPSSRGDGPRLR